MFKSVPCLRWIIISILFMQCNRNNQSTNHNASSSNSVPTTASPKKLVVMLHGSHSNGNEWKEKAKAMQKLFPGFHFLTPNGREKSDKNPNGWNWFHAEDLYEWKTEMTWAKPAARFPLIQETTNKVFKKLIQQMPTDVVDHQLVQKVNNNLLLNAKEIHLLTDSVGRYIIPYKYAKQLKEFKEEAIKAGEEYCDHEEHIIQMMTDAEINDQLKEMETELIEEGKLSKDEQDKMEKDLLTFMHNQLSPTAINERMEQLSRKGIINDKQIDHLMKAIQQKQAELNLTNKDTIIIGASLGAIMALYLTLVQKEPFLCTIASSGLLLPPMGSVINTQTSICLIHGEKDDRVPVECLDAAEQYCVAHGVPCSSHKILGCDHSVLDYKKNPKALNLVTQFIKKHIKA